MRYILAIIPVLVAFLFGFVLVRKAGYSRGMAAWIALCLLVPVVNLVVFIWFLATDWPLQRQVWLMRGRYAPAGEQDERDAAELFGEAARLEDAGDFTRAQRMYEDAAERYAGTPHENYARACLRTLAEKAARARL